MVQSAEEIEQNMNLALIGLPQAGKKTIFELMTDVAAEKAPTRDGISCAMVRVRDPRVDRLTAMYQPKRTRYAEFETVLPPDLAPDVGRDAKWTNHIQKADALLLVVRAFAAPQVFHVSGSVDPVRDLELVETELLLADLTLVDTRLNRIAKEASKHATNVELEKSILTKCQATLADGHALRILTFREDEQKVIRNLQFLTLKPMVVVFNVGEDLHAAEKELAPVIERLKKQGAEVVCLCASIEREIRELEPSEREVFMKELGVEEPAAHRLTRAVYQCLGLISFFTVGPDEVRAWSVRRGAKAPEAAGKIHSDLERGFIRADTVSFDHLMSAGSEKAAREANHYRLNGKEYEVKDGDIIEVKFNV